MTTPHPSGVEQSNKSNCDNVVTCGCVKKEMSHIICVTDEVDVMKKIVSRLSCLLCDYCFTTFHRHAEKAYKSWIVPDTPLALPSQPPSLPPPRFWAIKDATSPQLFFDTSLRGFHIVDGAYVTQHS